MLVVLAALEKDSEKKRKLGEINEEGLTLIHCAARCDGAHRGRGECMRLKCLKRLIEMGAGMPREGGWRVEIKVFKEANPPTPPHPHPQPHLTLTPNPTSPSPPTEPHPHPQPHLTLTPNPTSPSPPTPPHLTLTPNPTSPSPPTPPHPQPHLTLTPNPTSPSPPNLYNVDIMSWQVTSSILAARNLICSSMQVWVHLTGWEPPFSIMLSRWAAPRQLSISSRTTKVRMCLSMGVNLCS